MADPDSVPATQVTASNHHRLVGLAVFACAFGLYLKTVAPTVSFWG